MELRIGEAQARARQCVLLAQASQRESQSRQAAQHYSQAARHLQAAFENLSTEVYGQETVVELIREITDIRKTASQIYCADNDPLNAGYELSHSARCLESYAQYFVTSRPLAEAVEYRASAVNLFRTTGEPRISLAFELSYLSKAFTFLRQNFANYRTPAIRDRIIECRSEAATLFEKYEKFKDTYYEYRFLVGLLSEKADSDPSFFAPLIVASLKAAEMCKKAGLDLAWIPRFYRVAASAYRRLARNNSDDFALFYREQARELELMILEIRDEIDAAYRV